MLIHMCLIMQVLVANTSTKSLFFAWYWYKWSGGECVFLLVTMKHVNGIIISNLTVVL